MTLPSGTPRAAATAVVAGLLVMLLAGCSSASGGQPAATGTGSPATSSAVPSTTRPTTGTPVTTPAISDTGNNGATAAPSWLGHRVLPIGPNGFGIANGTPRELRPRKIITVDVLPPPVDGQFHSRIAEVSASVAARSSWSADCPVSLGRLRYVTVSFRGFDGRAHTGELLVNRSVAADVVTVFRRLFAIGFPIEQMQITTKAGLAAAPTGDGNDTSAFACRPVRGQKVWSQHAYGLAIDVDPFDNPYVDGRTVLPELASYYTDRHRGLPGMITPGSPAERAFASIGWGWGGDFSSKKDWMHFSSTGG